MNVADAVADAGAHLRGPLFASTVTTVMAFAPIVLLPGAAGDFVGYIGVSVILAITSSFFISLTVIAALAGSLFYGLLALLERSLTFWHPSYRQG